MPPVHICKNNGISLTVFFLLTSLIIIIISTIDFHTKLIWDLHPRVNGEIRYMVTVFAIGVMFIYFYCQQLKIMEKFPI
jgi:hypothetical protein